MTFEEIDAPFPRLLFSSLLWGRAVRDGDKKGYIVLLVLIYVSGRASAGVGDMNRKLFCIFIAKAAIN